MKKILKIHYIILFFLLSASAILATQINSAQASAVRHDQLKELKREMSHIDVLFIIDATGSMDKDYSHIKRAVRKIAIQMKKSGLKPRFSINFYKDYVDDDGKDGNDSYLFKHKPLTENIQQLMDLIDQEDSSGGGDEPEAIYHAIKKAIDSARSEVHQIGYRVAIVIADAPNHRPDSRGYTPAKIAQTLANNGYDFFFLEVGHAPAFTRQMQEIAWFLSNDCTSTTPFHAKERGSEITDAIIQIASKITEKTQTVLKLIDYLGVPSNTTSLWTSLLGRTHCLAQSENNQTIKRHQNHQHVDCHNFYERQRFKIKIVDKTTQKPISKFKIEQLVESNLDERVKITVFADNYYPKTVIVNQCPITVELEKIVRPSDIIYDQEENPSYILVIQDKAPVFKMLNERKRVMQAPFGMARYIADKVTFHGKTYYLMVDFDAENWEIKKLLGWISADYVLRDPKPLSDKGIAWKGLIIHNWQIDTSGHFDISMTHAYKGPDKKDYAPNATVSLFQLFFALAQKNGYTLLAREPSLAVESADTQLLGWVADKNLHLWKTRWAIEFDKSTIEQRKLGVKVFATQQELIDFYLKGKKIEPLAEEYLEVKIPWSPILMRYPVISEGSRQYRYLGNIYQIGVIGDQIYIDKGTAGLGTGFQEIQSQYGVRITLRATEGMQKKGINPRHFIAASAKIFQPGWVTAKEPGTSIRQVREVLLISRLDLESYVRLLSTFIKKPITQKTIMTAWKRALEENLGEADSNKPVSELVEARLGLPVKNKILQMTLAQINDLNDNKLKEFRQALYKDLLYLRSFVREEVIEVVEDKKSQFGWKPVRKGTRKVWWQFGDSYEYGWIPLEVMP